MFFFLLMVCYFAPSFFLLCRSAEAVYFWHRRRALTRFRAAPRRAGFILPTALPTFKTVIRWPRCLPQVAVVLPDFMVIPSAEAWMEIALLLAMPEYKKVKIMQNMTDSFMKICHSNVISVIRLFEPFCI